MARRFYGVAGNVKVTDMNDLMRAWQTRVSLGVFEGSSAVRVFHGPGEGSGDWQFFAIDRFQNHYWVTHWSKEGTSPHRVELIKRQIVEFLQQKSAQSVVGMDRLERGAARQADVWWGEPAVGKFEVREGLLSFWVQLLETGHPGLFLDHLPLRKWLLQNSRGRRVLNTFAYTGSLSVAAAHGGAERVTTLDLSKPSVEWAKENFSLNGIAESLHHWIAGDVFEWLPRLKKSQERFDCIIVDPPSFSHGKKGNFSTAKDLARLHSLALDLLDEGGVLVTSINSANVSWQKFESDVLGAIREKKMQFQILAQIDLPETFPTLLGKAADRYLKGWILRRSR
jgi:23S rRNA (cytosine1962-C5)-methyltransferase